MTFILTLTHPVNATY